MTAGPATGAPAPPSSASSGGVRWGARFSPQVLVFVATLAFASRPLKGAIIAGVFWWWGDTYQQVEFVMDEAQVNDGYPFIDGHLDGSTEVTRIAGMMVGDQIAPDGAPGGSVLARQAHPYLAVAHGARLRRGGRVGERAVGCGPGRTARPADLSRLPGRHLRLPARRLLGHCVGGGPLVAPAGRMALGSFRGRRCPHRRWNRSFDRTLRSWAAHRCLPALACL